MIHAPTAGDRPLNHFSQPQTALDIPPSFIQTTCERAVLAGEDERNRTESERERLGEPSFS
jgi:hypothetical protein